MSIFLEGHDETSDDLFATDPKKPTGVSPALRWGGRAEGANDDVSRYRAMGGRPTSAVRVDQTQANQARGMQMGSLAGLQNAAAGGAPSRSAALGQTSTENAIRAGQTNAARGRGITGSLASTRGSLAGVGQQAQAANMQLGEMRGQEIARDREALLGGVSGARRQDIGVATEDARLEAQRRALATQREKQYEQMAWDTRNADLFGSIDAIKTEEQRQLNERQLQAARAASEDAKLKDWIGMGAGSAMGLFGLMSDSRAKEVVPAGSLAGLMRRSNG